MKTEGNTDMLIEMGMFDNVLPYWYEAGFHRDKANDESNNISELLSHPSKDITAYNWAIAIQDFGALEAALGSTLETELKELMGVDMGEMLSLLEEMAKMLGIDEN